MAAPHRTLRWAALYAVLALVPLLWATPRTSVWKRALLPDQMTGRAYRPYVNRVLVPLLVRGFDAAIPGPARDRIRTVTLDHPVLRRRLGWEPAYASWYALVFLIHWFSLVLFAAAFQRLTETSLHTSEPASVTAAAVACLLVPLHFGQQNFVYDFPQLALITLGLWFLARHRIRAFYLLWPIGLLNKESFAVLAIAFWLTQRQFGWRDRIRHLAIQAGSAASLWLIIGWVFRGNPGTPLEWHLWSNFSRSTSLRAAVHFVAYAGFYGYAVLWWREKPLLVRSLLLTGGVLAASALFFGVLTEYRDYYEIFPILALMAVHSTLRWIRRAPVGLSGAFAAGS